MPDSLTVCLQEIENAIPLGDLLMEEVSAVSTFWHLSHSMLVIMGIVRVLEHSKADHYRLTLNLKWWFIRLRGSIPSGRGQSPKMVRPEGEIGVSRLEGAMPKSGVQAVEAKRPV
ncbi:hypothetical protein [Persicobacter sp. CCB-QB2]|uniref:hypothetical protein n=1 Tax=Persicobacter sp. CCB-QB2 TaxID=1561025 RepID=UPI0006A9FABF|nr:hypothetical protein [Persicobacter sp. CCB-QB2]